MRRVVLPVVLGAWLGVSAGSRGHCDTSVGVLRPSALQGALHGAVDGPSPEVETSIAEALRQLEAERARDEAGLLRLPGITVRELAVQGPVGSGAPGPLAAEVRTKAQAFDLAAGVRAEPGPRAVEPTEWSGRVGVANDHPRGREAFEMRTTIGGREPGRVFGVALGPRFERRLRRGATFFFDGRAAAETQRPEQGWRSLPAAAGDGSTTVGVTARAGIAR